MVSEEKWAGCGHWGVVDQHHHYSTSTNTRTDRQTDRQTDRWTDRGTPAREGRVLLVWSPGLKLELLHLILQTLQLLLVLGRDHFALVKPTVGWGRGVCEGLGTRVHAVQPQKTME